MAAIAVAGVGLMVVCSSSLAAIMLMGGEKGSTGPTGPTGPTGDEDDDSGAADTGDEDDDSGAADTGGSLFSSNSDQQSDTSAVEYHWEVKNFQEITTGQPFKSIENASVNDCRNKCEKKNKCVGFSIGPLVGTKRCILYSGMDVSTSFDMNKNTHLLSRV
jgi:hypothetical protein